MDPAVPFPKLKASKPARLSAFLIPGSRKNSNAEGSGGARNQPEGSLAPESNTHSRNASTSSTTFISKLSKKSGSRPSSSHQTNPQHLPTHPTGLGVNEDHHYPPPSFNSPNWQEQPSLANMQVSESLTALPPPPSVTGEGVYFATVTPPDSPALPGRPSQHPRSAPGSPLLLPVSSSPDSLDPKNTKKRRSFLPGGARRLSKQVPEKHVGPMPKAWIAGLDRATAEYDLSPIIDGGKSLELWEEEGDALIHIFPKTSGRGPSFKLFSATFASSTILTELAYGKPQSKTSRPSSRVPSTDLNIQPLESSMPSLSLNDKFADYSNSQLIELRPPLSLSAEMAFPTTRNGQPTRPTDDDLDRLIGIRNMFSFLVGQSLVATERRPTVFDVFLQVAEFLDLYNFTNIDGSTRGEVAEASFKDYVNELSLADVRSDPEKTIEALILAERMRRAPLYTEAFVHAVGQYSTIVQLTKQNSSLRAKFELISDTTRTRIDRAALDLQHREQSVQHKLEDFAFISMFVGLTDSKTAKESQILNFSSWKESFQATRKHVLSYYKQNYGSWPPKANSKKNELETSGLNRLVLKQIYEDFAQFYDLYVDSQALTTRGNDPNWLSRADSLEDPFLVAPHALRKIFDEYDRASPPVQPPIPFDTPLLPRPEDSNKEKPQPTPKNPSHEKPRSGHMDDPRTLNKKLPESNIQYRMNMCLNQKVLELVKDFTFISQLREFERKQAKGSSPVQLLNLRAGMWMFMYAVIQSLPMLVVDAPNLEYHDGCEYFLCEVPRGPLPWGSTIPNQSSSLRPSGATISSALINSNENTASLSLGGRPTNQRSWYGITGSTSMVQLPADLVEHGVEGIYRRSHCWIMAKEWKAVLDAAAAKKEHRRVSQESARQASRKSSSEQARRGPPSSPPRLPGQSRSDSPAGIRGARMETRESSIALGLTAMPVPDGIVAPPTRRPASRDGGRLSTPGPQHQQRSRSAGRYPSSGRIPGEASSTTFDDILGKGSKGDVGGKSRKARG